MEINGRAVLWEKSQNEWRLRANGGWHTFSNHLLAVAFCERMRYEIVAIHTMRTW